MTGQLSRGIAGSDQQLEKLNAAFFDFAKSRRRDNLLMKISKGNEGDSEKVRHFYKLFKIQHVTPEEENHSGIRDLHVLNRLLKVEKKALGKEYWDRKKVDAQRARLADLGFELEKKMNKKKPVRMRADDIESRAIFARSKNSKVYLEKMGELKRSNTQTFLPKIENIQTTGDVMKRRVVATKLVRSLGRLGISSIFAFQYIIYVISICAQGYAKKRLVRAAYGLPCCTCGEGPAACTGRRPGC